MKNLLKNGTQSRWFCMFVLIAIISLILMACPTPPGPDPEAVKSSTATLSSITIKGKAAGMGTPSAIMDNVIAGTVTIKDSDEGVTTGALADSKAALTKIVKFPASETSSFAAVFASKAPYNNEAVANGDFFVFLVTAEDGNTKLYYRVDVTVAAFMYPLTDANVTGETDFAKVKFFISDTLFEQDFYNNMTYAEVVKILGNPVTAITDNYAGKYLYAGEFTAVASGTLLKAGYQTAALTEEEPVNLVISLSATVAPPEPPSAVATGDLTITATVPNAAGDEGAEADASITIELANATVAQDLEDEDVSSFFSEIVDGLTYESNAAAGDNMIVITIAGMPKKSFYETAEIEIPIGAILDDKGNANIAPLEVSGSIEYDIDQAGNPEIEDVTFTPAGTFYAPHTSTAAGATLGTIEVVGGVAPFTYEISNATASFVIETVGSETVLKVGDTNLPAPYSNSEYYYMNITVTDSMGDIYYDSIQFTVNKYVAPLSDVTFALNESVYVGILAPGTMNNYTVSPYSMIGLFTAVGGNAMYTYELVPGTGDTDNDLFSPINPGSNNLTVGAAELTEAKEYNIRVKVTDSSVPATSIEKHITFTIGYKPSDEPRSASMRDGSRSITGTLANSDDHGANFNGASITIDMTNVKMTLPDYTDVSGWFSETIPGVTYTTFNVNEYDSFFVIDVSGTLDEDEIKEPISIEDVIITIPAALLLDSNGNPSIKEDLVVDGSVSYDITIADEDEARVGTSFYQSLERAINATTGNIYEPVTVTVIRNIELSSAVKIAAGKSVELVAESEGLTISPAEGYTGDLFTVQSSGVAVTRVDLGSFDTDVPTLIIDGKKQSNNLITANATNNIVDLTVYEGAELRNAIYSGIFLMGNNYDADGKANANINGGVILGCKVGVNAGSTDSYINFSSGTIYGANEGTNSNVESIRLVSLYGASSTASVYDEASASRITLTYAGAPNGDGIYTETFSYTAP
ncbi:MAG: hypothetical protein LBV20_05050 [Treponema sp.]|jgi:hypothetical protein|nr:hypothetical protein [Treponema sp.]